MSPLRVACLLGTGFVSGSLALALTGTFHWAYLAALGSMLWLTAVAAGQPSGLAGTPRDRRVGARSTRQTEPPRGAEREALGSSPALR